MKSEFDKIFKEASDKIEKLQKECLHKKSWLQFYYDHSIVGHGSAFPSIYIICKNCGTSKLIFIDWNEIKTKVIKTLKRQKGFKDQRFDIHETLDSKFYRKVKL